MGAAGLAAGLPLPAIAQGAQSWMDPALLAKAKAESGKLVVYSSVNEQEALVFWKNFEEATGIKIEYVRSNDTGLLARIAIEARAQQRSWDIIVTTAVGRMPPEFLTSLNPPLVGEVEKGAVGPKNTWLGIYANYNAPAFNTKLVKPDELPKTYEEFATRKEWLGKTGLDGGDQQWIGGMFAHFGDEKARKLLGDMAANLKPVITDGHLALARAVGAGEYAIAINNYLSLTNNVKMGGNPTEYWVLEPVVVFYGQVGASARAPNPNTALLAANFLISREGQKLITTQGRIPVRRDVDPNPPDLFKRIGNTKILPISLTADDEKKWTSTLNEIFKGRR
jgi:iron(III) transport system substrate-binding protein